MKALMNRQKGVTVFFIVCALFLALAFSPQVWAAPAKNVILLMTDGTSSTHITLTRWYKGSPLALDDILVGGLRTYSAESLVTDSAPAASAFATGYKTNSKFLGILPELSSIPGVTPVSPDLQGKPVATLLEGAKLIGKSVGLIATSNIQHATPAAFSAHTPYRDRYTVIAQQQVYEDIDVVFGGGKQYMLPKANGGTRTDEINLVDVLKAKGYGFIETREAMLNFKGRKVWGLFAPDAMQYEFDRKDLTPQEPSLAEMTKKAIELLSQNEKGFFLFVEASKVDWAAHSNDPIGVVSDLLAYDDAVKIALDFAKKDGQTLVMAFADHGTGGMSIGNKEFYKIYDKLPYDTVLGALKKASFTGEGMGQIIGADRSEFNIRVQMMQNYGVDDLTADEVAAIQKGPRTRAFSSVVGPMLSKRSAIGWIYTGHTGEDLFLYAYGPNKPQGLIENTDIAKITAQSLGFDLTDTDRKLFIDAEKAFSPLGASTRLDDSDPTNPALIVQKGLVQARMPLDRNILQLGKATYTLPGIVVLAPKTGKIFIPQKAVELIQAAW